jgi:hypothetical protein
MHESREQVEQRARTFLRPLLRGRLGEEVFRHLRETGSIEVTPIRAGAGWLFRVGLEHPAEEPGSAEPPESDDPEGRASTPDPTVGWGGGSGRSILLLTLVVPDESEIAFIVRDLHPVLERAVGEDSEVDVLGRLLGGQR